MSNSSERRAFRAVLTLLLFVLPGLLTLPSASATHGNVPIVPGTNAIAGPSSIRVEWSHPAGYENFPNGGLYYVVVRDANVGSFMGSCTSFACYVSTYGISGYRANSNGAYYIDSSAVQGTEYRYAVIAAYDDGSAWHYATFQTVTPVYASLSADPQFLGPSPVTAFSGDARVSLSWTNRYQYSSLSVVRKAVPSGTDMTGASQIALLAGSATAYLDTSATNGVRYCYEVRWTVGGTTYSSGSPVCATAGGVPNAPAWVDCASQAGRITLTWDQPSNGGSVLTYYRVFRATSNSFASSTSLVTVDSPSPPAVSFTDSSVVVGQTYYYWVLAANARGEGSPGGPCSGAASSPSGAYGDQTHFVHAPTMQPAWSRYDGIQLNWTLASTGGGPTGFKLYISPSGADAYTLLATNINAFSTSFFVGSLYFNGQLTTGANYDFKLLPYNDMGDGSYSNVVTGRRIPVGAPDPLQIAATNLTDEVFLQWSSLNPGVYQSGGAPLVYFVVRRYNDTARAVLSAQFTVAPNNVGMTDPTGEWGVTYYYDVLAYNEAGYASTAAGLYAGHANPPLTIPSAPRNVTGTEDTAGVQLTWQAPATDGGSPITHYRIYRGPADGSQALAAIATQGVGSNVTNSLAYFDSTGTAGVTYAYAVAAINQDRGEGPKSDTLTKTRLVALTTPSAPRDVAASAAAGQVVITWTAPSSNGGAAISGYTVYRYPNGLGGGSTLVNVGDVLTYTDTNVVVGSSYAYAVSARNERGEGLRSLLTQVVTVPPPADTTAPDSVSFVRATSDPLSRNATAWLKFDETTGTTAANALASSGTVTVDYVSGGSGGGATLDHTSTRVAQSFVLGATGPVALSGNPLDVRVKKVGSPAGTISFYVAASRDALQAQALGTVTTNTANAFATTYATESKAAGAGAILDPYTVYYVVYEYAGGTATDYLVIDSKPTSDYAPGAYMRKSGSSWTQPGGDLRFKLTGSQVTTATLNNMAETINTLSGTGSDLELNNVYTKLAQEFSVKKDAVVPSTAFTLRLYKSGSPTGTATVSLASGSASGTVVGATATISVSTLTTSPTDYTFNVAEGQTLAADVPYFIRVEYSGGTGSDRVFWKGSSASTIAGSRYRYSGSWAQVDAADLAFSVSLPESSAAWKTGPSGNALQFDGVDDYVSVPDHSALSFVDKRFTIAFWVNPASVTGNQGVLSKSDGGLFEYGVRRIDTDPSGQFSFNLWTIGGNNIATSTFTLTASTWQHVVITSDGATLRVYKNGVQVNTASVGSGTVTDHSAALTIGRGRDTAGTYHFKGKLDDVVIARVPFSAAEVSALFANPGRMADGRGRDVVVVDWANPADADLYGAHVYRSTTAGFTPTAADRLLNSTLTPVTFSDENVRGNTTYYYKVRAFDTSFNAASDASTSVITGYIPRVATVPVRLVATPGQGQVLLTWAPPTDDGGKPILNYRVYRQRGNEPLAIIGNPATTSFVDSTGLWGIEYGYSITALNAIGESPHTQTVTATSTAPPGAAEVPQAPRALSASTVDTGIALAWTVPESDGGTTIVAYRVYRGVGSGGSGETMLALVSVGTAYTDTTAAPGVIYRYAVTAFNAIGEGPRATTIVARGAGASGGVVANFTHVVVRGSVDEIVPSVLSFTLEGRPPLEPGYIVAYYRRDMVNNLVTAVTTPKVWVPRIAPNLTITYPDGRPSTNDDAGAYILVGAWPNGTIAFSASAALSRDEYELVTHAHSAPALSARQNAAVASDLVHMYSVQSRSPVPAASDVNVDSGAMGSLVFAIVGSLAILVLLGIIGIIRKSL